MQTQFWILSISLLAFGSFCLKELFSKKELSARIQKQGSSPFLGYLPMEFAYRILTPVGKAAAHLKISPNFFSWTCLTLGLIAGIIAGTGYIATAGAVSLVSSVFDALDGMVARNRGIASDAGEVLDAAVDRYTEFFFLGGVCIYYRFEPWAMVLTLFALMGSILVSYSQAKAEALKTEIPKGWMRRPERATYLGAGAFLSPLFAFWFEPGLTEPVLHHSLLFAMFLVGIFSNATAAYRFVIMYRKLKS